jgi:tetratricopeptide (TPR) repeat protein
MRKYLAALAVLVVATIGASSDLARAECPRPAPANAEAINLANEGDKARATNLEAAIAKYKEATQLDPTNHRILWKLVLAYVKKEQWQEVSDAAALASKLAPRFATYVFMQGNALEHLQRWKEAREPLEKAIALDPGYADAHYELAEVLLHLRDEKGALDHYTKAIERKPDDAIFYASLADLYLRLGYSDEAEQTAKAGIELVTVPEKRFPLFMLAGMVRDEKKDIPGAVARFEEAKRACGECVGPQSIVLFELGVAYASLVPPRKSEAMAQLQAFNKRICKGAAAQRYADQCAQAQVIAMKLGGAVP